MEAGRGLVCVQDRVAGNTGRRVTRGRASPRVFGESAALPTPGNREGRNAYCFQPPSLRSFVWLPQDTGTMRRFMLSNGVRGNSRIRGIRKAP